MRHWVRDQVKCILFGDVNKSWYCDASGDAFRYLMDAVQWEAWHRVNSDVKLSTMNIVRRWRAVLENRTRKLATNKKMLTPEVKSSVLSSLCQR
jgi:hypothetical protein